MGIIPYANDIRIMFILYLKTEQQMKIIWKAKVGKKVNNTFLIAACAFDAPSAPTETILHQGISNLFLISSKCS